MCMPLLSILECVNNNEDTKLQDLTKNLHMGWQVFDQTFI